jgi:PIN like domain
MKLFVDEDTGSGLARALRAVRVDIDFVGSGGSFSYGAKDELWLPFAGKHRLLVLSRNIAILRSQTQCELVVSENVGIVFLPPGLTAFELLRLVIKKWAWLNGVDATELRPFAFRLSRAGRAVQLALPAYPATSI